MAKKLNTHSSSPSSELRPQAEEPLKTQHLAAGISALSTTSDISEQKHTEEELRQSNSRYRSLFQNKHNVMLIIDQHDGAIVDANPAAASYYGWTRDELCSMNIKQINQLSDEEIQSEMQLASAESRSYFLFRHLRADGSLRDVEVYSGPITIEHKSLLYSLIHDITDRKRSENQLLENQKRFNQALEAAHAGVWEWSVKTNNLIWSKEIWPLHGLERSNEKPTFEFWVNTVHPDDRDMAIEAVTAAAAKSTELRFEYRVFGTDGSVHWLMSRGMPLYDEHGNVERYIGTIIDITRQKNLELQLVENQARFTFMLEKSKLGGWDLDLQDQTAHRTLLHDRIFGYESLLPEWTYQMFLDHVIPEDRSEVDRKFQSAIEALSEWNFECRIRRTDGEVRWIWAVGGYQYDHTGKANRISGIVKDITERKVMEEERDNLQQQLQQRQKMQLVGQLAGGIAHDFNNMLMVILGHTELALDHQDSSYEDLKVIQKAATHSAELTRQLLAFARKQTVVAKVLNLNTAIEEMLSVLRSLIGENITLIWIPKAKNALVTFDPSQIDQMLANLCINARDAIDSNGNITIETAIIQVDQAESATGHPCTIPGDYVTLTITDNGHGIDKKHLPHIFEPFFTTREVGQGTGMGLATVYGIVKQASGFIDVESAEGKGTTIRIYLPLQRDQDAALCTETAEPPLPHGKGIILLVEDQPDILQLCRQMLVRSGYTVLSAATPKEAIKLAEKYKKEIDLLVTDVIMPEMNGSDLYQKLQSVSQQLKVLYMSGYTADIIKPHHTTDETINFIEKPFSIDAFINAIQKALKASHREL
ncbi:MAG: PAS domain S-box protein [Chlorobiales bacterium]|nr:PAS domain S-box protein [Chlorobiales bacterium]